jgi:hypothetical protein
VADGFDWLLLFEQAETTGLGRIVRESLWLFPVIESVHLIGLASLGGAVLAVDLRLLGLVFLGQPVAAVMRAARPWFFASLGLMFATGIPLFLSEAVKCYFGPSFWVKMVTLAIAIAFVLAVRNPLLAIQRTLAASRTATNLLLGVASMGLWLTVAAAGRWIGFS